jgi:hypothetical protein
LSLMKSIEIRSESAIKLLAEFLDMDTEYVEGQRYPNAEHFAHGGCLKRTHIPSYAHSFGDDRGLFLSPIPVQGPLRVRHGSPVRRPLTSPRPTRTRTLQTVGIAGSPAVALQPPLPLAFAHADFHRPPVLVLDHCRGHLPDVISNATQKKAPSPDTHAKHIDLEVESVPEMNDTHVRPNETKSVQIEPQDGTSPLANGRPQSLHTKTISMTIRQSS